jgi:hypothetical protein
VVDFIGEYYNTPISDQGSIHEDTFKYKHVAGLRGKFEIDLWVPIDMDATWGLRKIFRDYAERERRE